MLDTFFKCLRENYTKVRSGAAGHGGEIVVGNEEVVMCPVAGIRAGGVVDVPKVLPGEETLPSNLFFLR